MHRSLLNVCSKVRLLEMWIFCRVDHQASPNWGLWVVTFWRSPHQCCHWKTPSNCTWWMFRVHYINELSALIHTLQKTSGDNYSQALHNKKPEWRNHTLLPLVKNMNISVAFLQGSQHVFSLRKQSWLCFMWIILIFPALEEPIRLDRTDLESQCFYCNVSEPN